MRFGNNNGGVVLPACPFGVARGKSAKSVFNPWNPRNLSSVASVFPVVFTPFYQHLSY